VRRTASDIHDEWLVLRCQAGEKAALPLLVDRWQARLYRFARRLVDRADVAGDVMQEAWLAIVRSLERLDDPARFGPWAYRIVTNKCRDRVRERVRQRDRSEKGDVAVEDISAPECADAAHHSAGRNESLHALRLALRELSPAHRAVLALHYLDGMGISEIAFAMGTPEGTVKSRLHHARERLRAIIEQKERIRS
jgi:RNA polymerase sigma-70 factor, ECF subfamily